VLYQLQDDLLDLFDAKGRDAKGSDIYEGRLTALVLTHLDLHPEQGPALFEVLAKPREETSLQEVERVIARFIDGGAAAQLLARIELLASELLASDALNRTPGIHAVAAELVASVLAPLDAVNGGRNE
jgi:geranylgeranyl pyrophosphate synthase